MAPAAASCRILCSHNSRSIPNPHFPAFRTPLRTNLPKVIPTFHTQPMRRPDPLRIPPHGRNRQKEPHRYRAKNAAKGDRRTSRIRPSGERAEKQQCHSVNGYEPRLPGTAIQFPDLAPHRLPLILGEMCWNRRLFLRTPSHPHHHIACGSPHASALSAEVSRIACLLFSSHCTQGEGKGGGSLRVASHMRLF
jgi:hypothetical protein